MLDRVGDTRRLDAWWLSCNANKGHTGSMLPTRRKYFSKIPLIWLFFKFKNRTELVDILNTEIIWIISLITSRFRQWILNMVRINNTRTWFCNWIFWKFHTKAEFFSTRAWDMRAMTKKNIQEAHGQHCSPEQATFWRTWNLSKLWIYLHYRPFTLRGFDGRGYFRL